MRIVKQANNRISFVWTDNQGKYQWSVVIPYWFPWSIEVYKRNFRRKIYYFFWKRQFKKWIKFARENNMYITIDKDYLDRMEKNYK